jgi:NAD(P)H-flavin reductase/ferredoxin
MPTLRFGDFSTEIAENETALDALIRTGAPVSYACKAGSCGSCMLKAVDGDLPDLAQTGLKDAWKARRYFLACMCRPASDLTAAAVGSDAQVAASIAALEPLSADVMRVRIAYAEPFDFRAGQYITLLREDGLARSYSIASLPEEGHLDLHVRCLPNGRMSEWIRKQARSGDRVRVLGPSGDCFYVGNDREQPLLLAGTGTGLAPLYGVLRDAINQNHSGPIHLFHGAINDAGLYLRDELTKIAQTYSNVEYTPTLLERDGPLDQVILNRFPKFVGWRAYLCGDPALVQSLKKKLFLRGGELRNIHADAFIPAA